MGAKSLVNLGDVTKPVNTLIERLSDLMGGALLPIQMKRKARAQVEVDKIAAIGAIELSDIQRRGMSRVIAEAERTQMNIESIITESLSQIKVAAEPEKVDEDWLANFLGKAKNVSSAQMQSLWAKLLAGEVNSPGSFCKATLSIVDDLERQAAQHFTNVIRFNWNGIGPVIFDNDDAYTQSLGLFRLTLQELQSSGLLIASDFGLTTKPGREAFTVSYFGRRVKIAPSAQQRVPIGLVYLTRSGRELASLSGATPIEGYYQHTIAQWRKEGLSIEELPS